ncbi:unnamed protein product, partial [Mesorhabditis spiculigera]
MRFCLFVCLALLVATVSAKKAKDTPCSSTTECNAGLKCCTMCPADAACGPGTEFSPTCDDGPCESPNWLEFE